MNLLALFLSLKLIAQVSCGGGSFPEYKLLGIQKVEEFIYDLNGSNMYDSILRKTLFFNRKGQMIKEQFNYLFTQPFYSYSYNTEGFLTNIDTSGRFGFGISSYTMVGDTTWVKSHSEKKWFRTDTMERLHYEIIYLDSNVIKTEYHYNSKGKIVQENSYLKNKNDKYTPLDSKTYLYNEMNLLWKVIWKNEVDEQIGTIQEFRYSME